METKVFKFQIKELEEESGTFRGYLSVFGNVDHGGDLVVKGAFKKTLTENAAFPLLWAHSSQEPRLVVGSFHGNEDNHGLKIEGKFFKELTGGKEAYDVVKRLKEESVRVGLSIGYKAVQWDEDKVDNEAVRRLKEIQLFEGSLTLFPMNDQAVVQAVKDSLEDTAGKSKTVSVVCSKCGETVMEITDPAEEALDASEPDKKSTPKNEPPEESQMDRAWRRFFEDVGESIKKLTN